MDRLIARFDAECDGDLMLSPAHGVAWQRDMRITASYDEAYFAKCAAKEGNDLAQALNRARVELVDRHHSDDRLLDIGVGTGAFIRARGRATFGTDVNPKARTWLSDAGRLCDDLTRFGAFTMWDVLEHLAEPELTLRRMAPDSYLFCALPVFDDLAHVRASKHYRPGEHLYYWTEQGFIGWMALWRFRCLEVSRTETDLGRDSILSFAFVRDLPGYGETVAQYREMHGRTYGASASGLYLDTVAEQVLALKPTSILDYGCGQSDLVAHFWRDGKRRIARYDPAVAAHKVMPEGPFDVVLCTDVMEHIPMADVDRVLAEIKAKSNRVLFAISTRPARATLPDGRNAHVTILSAEEWTRWVGSVFGKAKRIPTSWEHELMLRTW